MQLVCSCYVPSRSIKRETKEETNNKSINTKLSSPSVASVSNKDHHTHHCGILIEDVCAYTNDHKAKIIEVVNRSTSNINGGMEVPPTPIPLKSNLKKLTVAHQKADQTTLEIRKVSWPDDHGQDIAHVLEFEPSVSDEEDLGGVLRNSCVCVIL